MFDVRQTERFEGWLIGLADSRAQARIARLQSGLFGDVKPVGNGVSEARIDYGPGYRLYFVQRGRTVIILLCGGDKRTQDADIRLAKQMVFELKA
jgi:putative addiction module killer protein